MCRFIAAVSTKVSSTKERLFTNQNNSMSWGTQTGEKEHDRRHVLIDCARAAAVLFLERFHSNSVQNYLFVINRSRSQGPSLNSEQDLAELMFSVAKIRLTIIIALVKRIDFQKFLSKPLFLHLFWPSLYVCSEFGKNRSTGFLSGTQTSIS